jgi:TolA-binding protein
LNLRSAAAVYPGASPPVPVSLIRLRPDFFGLLFILLAPVRLTADPTDDAYRLARACLTSNRFTEAATHFEAAASSTNATIAAAAWLGRGEALYSVKQWDAAISAYNTVLTAYPESPLAPNALCARGFAETQLARLPQAQATFTSFLERFPSHALAATATASGRAIAQTLEAQAKQKAEAALARETAYINTCMLNKRFLDAAHAAERFLLAHPDTAHRAELSLIAANCAFRAGDLARAQNAYRTFLSQHPQHAQATCAWFELGKILDARSLYDEAASAFEKAKDNAESAARQADSLFKAGRTTDALRLYETISHASTDKLEVARTTLAMGDCYAAQEKWAEAERFFLSVETLHASETLRPIALDRLTALYERMGQTNLATRTRAERHRRFPDRN